MADQDTDLYPDTVEGMYQAGFISQTEKDVADAEEEDGDDE